VTLRVPPRGFLYYDDGNPSGELLESGVRYTDGTRWRAAPGTRFSVIVGGTSDPETLARRGVSGELAI
jgi:hypothetical protein